MKPADGMLWVLVADEGVAHFYRLPARDTDLERVETLTDSAAHADRADLRRDAAGRRSAGGPGDGHTAGTVTASAGRDELAIEAERFARRVSDHLAQALQDKRFSALRVAAAPRFLGLLRQALSPQVAATVIDDTPHDLVHMNARNLTRRFFPPPAQAA